jgi:hypothetical protein
MTLAELSKRAEALDLHIRPVDALEPSRMTIIRDYAGDHYAFLNGDGLPLFTIEEAEVVVAAIAEAGDHEAWLPGYKNDMA